MSEFKYVSVVVLAGGCKEYWREFVESGYRALININGRPMWRWVCDAFRDAGFKDIAVVADWIDADVITPEGYRLVRGGKLHSENMLTGVRAARYDKVILSTCDLLHLSATSIKFFSWGCQHVAGLEIGYSIIDMKDYNKDERFKGMKRTTVKLKEGRFNGGNVFWLDRSAFLRKISFINRLYAMRKQPWKYAKLFGFSFLLRFIMAQTFPSLLSIDQLEKRASEIIGLRVRAISADPELGADIDKPEQLRTFLASR